MSPAFPALTATGTSIQLGFGDVAKSVAYSLRDLRLQRLKETHSDLLVNSAVMSVRFGMAITNAASAFKVVTA